jgi:aminopeptidase N
LGKNYAQNQELKVLVEYGGQPRIAPRPPWSGGFTWSKTKSGAHWIATSCQGEGADIWWPCKDHPSDKPDSMDLAITVPRGLYVASNGVLDGRDEAEDRSKETFRWKIRTPISNYCVALNIAPYVVLGQEYESVCGDKFPVFFFCLPEHEERARKVFPQFLEHLRSMEEFCGPYPFRGDKYAVVETPHLGMEHQTIIAYGNGYQVRKDGYDWLHHHEMSHEWWGNLVTCRDWKDMWIHEGIGTYMQALYLEKLRGRAGYNVEMASKRSLANRKAVAPKESNDSHQIYFQGGGGNDIYNKGSWIMHTLRWVLGEDPFFVALRRMAYPDPAMEKVKDGSCARFSDTEEIRSIVEKVHGADLKWFFDLYLYQPALPKLEYEHQGGTLKLKWETPDSLPFPMPVPVIVNGELKRVPMPGGKGELKISEGVEWAVDPDQLVLKEEPRRRRGGGSGR